MKEIYIETICHGNTLAGVVHCKQIAKEQGTIMYEDCIGNFGVVVAVNISRKESYLQ